MMTWAAVVLTVATVGADYRSAVVSGGLLMGCAAGMPYHRLVEGRVPEGLWLQPGGDFRGIPKHAGEYSLIVEATNGCTRALVPVRLSVKGRPILAAFDTEVELNGSKPRVEVRVFADRPGLAYTVETSDAWLKARPLLGRTPAEGEALTADLLAIEVDWSVLAGEERKGEARGEVRLSCFRCRGTVIAVGVALPAGRPAD